MKKEDYINYDFNSIYCGLLEHLFAVYTLNIFNNYKGKRYEILQMDNWPQIDYIVELKPSEMPISYICEDVYNKTEIIPNINQNETIKEYNTVFERITKTELLGFFAKVNNKLINELKSNGFIQYKYESSSGKKTCIKVDDLVDKKVIFMCPDNIRILHDNLVSLSNKEIVNLKESDILEYRDLFKIVFYHECGHCAFYDLNTNPNKKYNDVITRERQANYYASIVLMGQYDLLIEMLNNRIGKQYKNPLLKSHEYTKGKLMLEEERKLYE